VYILQLNVERRSALRRIEHRSGSGHVVFEHRDCLDSFLAQLLTVLNQHPHDPLELNGAEKSLAFFAAGLERASLGPQWQITPVFCGLTEDVAHDLLSGVCQDHRDEDVLQSLEVSVVLRTSSFPSQESYVGRVRQGRRVVLTRVRPKTVDSILGGETPDKHKACFLGIRDEREFGPPANGLSDGQLYAKRKHRLSGHGLTCIGLPSSVHGSSWWYEMSSFLP
jgi:hypothetical protein